MAPPDMIDYVIWHEMMHIKERTISGILEINRSDHAGI